MPTEDTGCGGNGGQKTSLGIQCQYRKQQSASMGSIGRVQLKQIIIWNDGPTIKKLCLGEFFLRVFDT